MREGETCRQKADNARAMRHKASFGPLTIPPILPLATLVGFSDHLVLAELAVVGDEEEVAEAPAQVDLSPFLLDELASTTMR